MSNTKNYIVTTLSSGSQEFNNSISNTYQAPFSLASSTVIGLRQKGAPYTISQAQNLYSRKILDAESITVPTAKYTFDSNPKDGTVPDDSGNGLTGTLTCSYGENATYSDFSCYAPEFDAGTWVGPLAGVGSLHISGGWNGVSSAEIQKAGHVKFQTLAYEPKWKILTGSHSVSFWIYLTAPGVTQRCDTVDGVEYCRDTIGDGGMQLFGMCVDPQLNNPSEVNPSGSFFLMQNQDRMDYYDRGPLAWSFRRPAVAPNPATNFSIEYPYLNRDGVPQTGYFTNDQWNHIMYCVSGDEGDGSRFVAAYVNGQKMDTEDADDAPTGKLWGKSAWVGVTSDYDYTFSVTASQKTYSPLEHVYLGDCNPVATTGVHFTGSIDSLAIWDKYFTAKQVTQIYESSGTLFDIVNTNFPYNK